jgi:hypothetical protein
MPQVGGGHKVKLPTDSIATPERRCHRQQMYMYPSCAACATSGNCRCAAKAHRCGIMSWSNRRLYQNRWFEFGAEEAEQTGEAVQGRMPHKMQRRKVNTAVARDRRDRLADTRRDVAADDIRLCTLWRRVRREKAQSVSRAKLQVRPEIRLESEVSPQRERGHKVMNGNRQAGCAGSLVDRRYNKIGLVNSYVIACPSILRVKHQGFEWIKSATYRSRRVRKFSSESRPGWRNCSRWLFASCNCVFT